MLKKTQFQLIISYFVYYIYFKKCQNLLLSRGFIAWTRTNYKIELQITREKMEKLPKALAQDRWKYKKKKRFMVWHEKKLD